MTEQIPEGLLDEKTETTTWGVDDEPFTITINGERVNVTLPDSDPEFTD